MFVDQTAFLAQSSMELTVRLCLKWTRADKVTCHTVLAVLCMHQGAHKAKSHVGEYAPHTPGCPWYAASTLSGCPCHVVQHVSLAQLRCSVACNKVLGLSHSCPVACWVFTLFCFQAETWATAVCLGLWQVSSLHLLSTCCCLFSGLNCLCFSGLLFFCCAFNKCCFYLGWSFQFLQKAKYRDLHLRIWLHFSVQRILVFYC